MRRLIHSLHPYIYDTHIVYGKNERLKVGKRVALANTLFNLSSGEITIGDRTIFGHNVMCLTGTHNFHKGKRISTYFEYDDGSFGGNFREVPTKGRDIHIGSGCFIGSGSILIGPLNIGADCIIGAGSIVTNDFPAKSIIMGGKAIQAGNTNDISNEKFLL